jgi:hypothetical protein
MYRKFLSSIPVVVVVVVVVEVVVVVAVLVLLQNRQITVTRNYANTQRITP